MAWMETKFNINKNSYFYFFYITLVTVVTFLYKNDTFSKQFAKGAKKFQWGGNDTLHNDNWETVLI